MTTREIIEADATPSTSDIAWWTRYARSQRFSTPEEARDFVFRRREISDRSWPSPAGPEANRIFADAMPVSKSGQKWRIGGRPKPLPQPLEKVGVDLEEVSRREMPEVNWEAKDNYGVTWNETTVRAHLGLPADTVVYTTAIPLDQLKPRLAGGHTQYGWDELRGRGAPPPVVVTRTARGMRMEDGNHRVYFWQHETDFTYAPAWVADDVLTRAQRRGLWKPTEDSEEIVERLLASGSTRYEQPGKTGSTGDATSR